MVSGWRFKSHMVICCICICGVNIKKLIGQSSNWKWQSYLSSSCNFNPIQIGLMKEIWEMSHYLLPILYITVQWSSFLHNLLDSWSQSIELKPWRQQWQLGSWAWTPDLPVINPKPQPLNHHWPQYTVYTCFGSTPLKCIFQICSKARD